METLNDFVRITAEENSESEEEYQSKTRPERFLSRTDSYSFNSQQFLLVCFIIWY